MRTRPYLMPCERINALLARGVELYLSETGELRARCDASASNVLEAARTMLRVHRAAIISELQCQNRPAKKKKVGRIGSFGQNVAERLP